MAAVARVIRNRLAAGGYGTPRAQPPQDPAQRAKVRFRAFPARCLALGSQFIAMPARYEFADLAHIAFSLAGRSGAAAMALAGDQFDAHRRPGTRQGEERNRAAHRVAALANSQAQSP
jgi:hypothetical protein